MKTSHEMAKCVIEKSGKILCRRRIIAACAGTLAGTAAVAAALMITLNFTRPRGVDLIDSGANSQSDSTPASENSVEPNASKPQYLYNNVEIRENSGADSHGSYSELMDSLQEYKGKMNFYEFTITKQYTPDEAVELTGSEIFRSDSTLFYAHIVYEHLNEMQVDTSILLAQNGNAESQAANCPLYGVGESYLAFIPESGEKWSFVCPELTFSTNGSETCMHLNAEQITLEADGVRLGEDIPEDRQYVCTTTDNNPVKYVREYSIDELTGFLRSDWAARGLLNKSGAGLPNTLTRIETADIPDIPAEERGLQAVGARNVLLDAKTAGDLSVLLVGDYVSTDTENYPDMINCFKFGLEIYDGNTLSELSAAPFDLGQGKYWLYNDRLPEYTQVFQFGENYIVALRYFESDGSCRAVFNAIKGGELYPTLMGDYSAASGVQTGVTTLLSDNLTVDEKTCTITDNSSGISYAFDFDAISDSYTRPHYTAAKSDSGKEAVSALLAEHWLKKWEEISQEMFMSTPQASIFSFELKNGSRLAAIVYPTYKTNSAALYRVTDNDFTEYGVFGCGWQFELLENSEEQYLHIITKYAGSAANPDSLEIDDSYYRITENALELVLNIGRNIYENKAYDWFVYENESVTHISGEEYEQLKANALNFGTVVYSTDIDKNGDYLNDEYIDFADDPEGLKSAILSALQ